MAKFFLTTSLPYVNDSPHIGFAQEIVAADGLARWHRTKDDQTFFLTGTDEHGLKVARAAREAGLSPEKFAAKMALEFRDLKNLLNLSFDHFIRTTDSEHHKNVVDLWRRVNKRGDLYKKQYSGLYCVGCESFKQAREIQDGRCLIHQIPLEKLTEENYFFRLSAYREKIRQHLKTNPDFVQPKARYNEILSFVEQGLEDISVSRPKEKLSWGIPVPDDPNQMIYVWFDALINYLYPKDFWPAQLHIIGKDIARFHAILWPAILISAGLALPEKIYVHGFISVEGRKMSKSLDNVIHPRALVEKFGQDATRYLLVAELSFVEDSDFSWDKAMSRYNSDLANDLGNLVQRFLVLAQKNKYNPKISSNSNAVPITITGDPYFSYPKFEQFIEKLQFQEALGEVWNVIRELNQRFDHDRPWALSAVQLESFLDNSAGAILTMAKALSPFMPKTSQAIAEQIKNLEPKPLFPRMK